MIPQPQCVHVGANLWIAHSKLSNVCRVPPIVTSNDFAYSFPQTSRCHGYDSCFARRIPTRLMVMT
jgi:hypothetical protein